MDAAIIEATMAEVRSALEADRLDEAIAALSRLHPADQADAYSDLDNQGQAALLPMLGIEATADLLEELETYQRTDIAESLTTERLADVLDEMEPDDAADILGDLPPEVAAETLAEMEDAQEVLPLLPYADETAGGLMTTSFIALRPDTSAIQAIEFLRQLEPEAETPYYLYVEDSGGHIVGIVGLRDLVVSQPNAMLQEIMQTDVVYVRTQDDQEDVARTMAKYDLAALPVVDDHNILQGVITHDDVFDVIEDEATEDIYRLANVPDPDLTVDSPIGISIRRRLPWLYLSALTALFASWVITHFEDLIAQAAILAAFLSVVAGVGGNTATQSLALYVRGIALGEIDASRAWKGVIKEGITGFAEGILVGLAVGLVVYLWQGNYIVGLALCLALIFNMLVAGIAGAFVPLALKVLRLDPALASSVLVTTITDSFGFAIFLIIASLLLQVSL
jgi:magnesium transporter